jgi:hypothetical protein
VTPDGGIVALPITLAAGSAEPGRPMPLFNPRMNLRPGLRNEYVVSSDGRRFLVLKPVVDRTRSPVTVVLNWPSLFTR